ncbi:MAG: hypothetical protein PHV17_06195 [Candidatus Omnitrophica bacterium]|nr:hypothetical protein [Candidatus Omnitrophota bacterium]
MKKIFVVLSCAVLAVAVYYGLVKFVFVPKVVEDMNSLLPNKAVCYFYATDLKHKKERILESEFVKKLKSFPALKAAVTDKLSKINHNIDAVSDYFDNESALAVYSFGDMALNNRRSADFEIGKFAFVSRVGLDEKIKKALSDRLLKFSGDISTKARDYKGFNVVSYTARAEKSYRLAPINVYTVFLGDCFFFSNDRLLTLKAIDLFKAQSSDSLKSNAAFIKANQKYPRTKGTFLWLYFDQSEYYNSIVSQTAKGYLDEGNLSPENAIDFREMSKLFKRFEKLSYLTVADFRVDKSDNEIKLRVFQFVEPKNNHFILDNAVYGSGIAELFQLLPEDVVSCYAVSFDYPNLHSAMDKYFDSYLETIGKDNALYPIASGKIDQLKSRLQQAEKMLGIDFRKELLPLLGDTQAFAFLGLEEVPLPAENISFLPISSYPLPGLALLLEAKDYSSAAKISFLIENRIVPLIKKSIESRQGFSDSIKVTIDSDDSVPLGNEGGEAKPELVKIVSDSYNNIEIKTVIAEKIPVGLNYALLGKRIIFSSSLPELKRLIDRNEKKEKLSLKDKLAGDKIKDIEEVFAFSYFNLQELVSQLTQTEIFATAKPMLPMFSRGSVTADQLDALIDILSDISIITQKSKANELGVESLMSVTVEGL